MNEHSSFDRETVKNYPKSNRKIHLSFKPYDINSDFDSENNAKGQTTYISPSGIEFQGPADFPEGTLLKINIAIPDYWSRKQEFVNYRRVDSPSDFRILGRVVQTESIGKRGKKKLVLVQTVNIDEVDEKVLKSFLKDGK
tara:strand:- start:2 stop:421 length:420 start_codon:yes stop_codon:yes gene_type:complete